MVKTAREIAGSLARATQPNLRLPCEVVELIISFHVENNCAAKTSRHVPHIRPPYSLLTACKLFNRLATPIVYRRICLRGSKYFDFIRHANVGSLRYIQKVDLWGNPLGSKSALKSEVGAIGSLEKRAVAYKHAMEKQTGGESDAIWPTGVEFAVATGYEPRCAYICRLMKLFTMRRLCLAQWPSRNYASTINPPMRLIEVHAGALNSLYFFGEAYAGPDPDTVALFSIANTIDNVVISLGRESGSLANEFGFYLPGPYTSRVSQLADAAEKTRNVCGKVRDTVTLDPIPRERHAFCCNTDKERSSVMHPKLRLKCCDGPCEVEKTQLQRILNALMRSTEPPNELTERLVRDGEDAISYAPS